MCWQVLLLRTLISGCTERSLIFPVTYGGNSESTRVSSPVDALLVGFGPPARRRLRMKQVGIIRAQPAQRAPTEDERKLLPSHHRPPPNTRLWRRAPCDLKLKMTDG